jgi:hypothetical protein
MTVPASDGRINGLFRVRGFGEGQAARNSQANRNHACRITIHLVKQPAQDALTRRFHFFLRQDSKTCERSIQECWNMPSLKMVVGFSPGKFTLFSIRPTRGTEPKPGPHFGGRP